MITETWYHENDDILDFSGYNSFFLNRTGRRGGGILILAKKDFKCEILESFSSLTIDYEVLSLQSNSLVLSVVYRPPNGNTSKFFEFLDAYFSWINDRNLTLVLGGDLNINLLDTSSAQSELAEIIEVNGFVSPINQPTRVRGNNSTLLDLFVTNIDEASIACGVIAADISDHLPVYIFLSWYCAKTERLKTCFQCNFKILILLP